jgi:isocitrate dehydrogenase
MTKDNIMKLTDGLFHRLFDEIGAEYPELQREHLIVDIGAARVAASPERFDVIVLPNLYGDILSDVAAEVAGSVGMAASANLGEHGAMFEAVHGSAPDIAGRNLANPSGLLGAAVMMLRHLGEHAVARTIHDAWLCTIEEGIHTADIATPAHTEDCTSTSGFAAAVIRRLGRQPRRLASTPEGSAALADAIQRPRPTTPARKELVGVDLFLHWSEGDRDPDALARQVRGLADGLGLELAMITNRGTKVWPDGLPETFCTDHWRCRFQAKSAVHHGAVVALLGRAADIGLDFIKTEHLYTFDGVPGFSLGQGQ